MPDNRRGFLIREGIMQTSDRGIALIKHHEGVRLTAYPDPGKGWAIPTIGYGHTSAAGPPAVYKGMKITQAGADEILRQDLAKFERYVADAVKVPLSQNEFDALVSFTFNLGPGNLRSSTLLRKLNAGDKAGAADEFLKWTKAGGKTLPGLVKRREAERALFRAPIVDPRPAPKPIPVGTVGEPAQSAEPEKDALHPAFFIVAFLVALVLAAIFLR